MNLNCPWTSLWRFVVLASVAAACSSARADDWILPPEVKETTNVFGNTKVVLHYDSTTNRLYPEYTLKIYQGEKRVGEHAGVGFDKVYADADNRYFLGVSNRGLVKAAWVVFDRDGRIIRHQPHGRMKYCRMSVSLVREWYYEKKPEPEFKGGGGKLQEVSVRDCEGRRIVLPLEVK